MAKESDIKEASVLIDGTPLSVGQVMTLRVAVTSFLVDINDEGSLGHDEIGEGLRTNYRTAGIELLKLLTRTGDKP